MFIKVQTKSGNETIINTDHIVELYAGVISMSPSHEYNIALSDESLAEIMEFMFPTKKTTKNHEPKDELAELFTKLHKLTKGRGVAVFTLKREKQLADLLGKHRMTEELLIKAATNIGNDAFLQGENDSKKRYGDVDYLLRPDKAAKWSEDQLQKKKPGLF